MTVTEVAALNYGYDGRLSLKKKLPWEVTSLETNHLSCSQFHCTQVKKNWIKFWKRRSHEFQVFSCENRNNLVTSLVFNPNLGPKSNPDMGLDRGYPPTRHGTGQRGTPTGPGTGQGLEPNQVDSESCTV